MPKHVDQLHENKNYKCGDLFQRVYNDINLCMSRAKAKEWHVGVENDGRAQGQPWRVSDGRPRRAASAA